jgi:CheY-like chemotaxis protein
MTFNVLVVEDETDFIDELQHVIDELPGVKSVKVAKSREVAFDLLETSFFDLVILDLKIPTIDGALDAEPAHGHAVFGKCRLVAPGTPILILTGSPAEDFIPALLGQQQQVDVWGDGKSVGTIIFLKKYKFNDCPAILMPIGESIHKVCEVELDRGQAVLTTEEDRLIRIFVRRCGGTRCVVGVLSGGLSGAKVMRLRVTDSQGVKLYDAVAKLGTHVDVRDEATRFNNLVSRLDPKFTPRMLAILEFGGRACAGVFYSLAHAFEMTAFDICKEASERPASAIKNVEIGTAPWVNDVPQTRRRIREIRQRTLTDDQLAGIRAAYDLAWIDQFEDHEIQVRWACVHGDLHGCNVLVDGEAEINLIDYGDVGPGPASFDPVTLELSPLFHPRQPLAGLNWPTPARAAQWGDLDRYLVDCPAPAYMRECRAWAEHVAAGKREIAASAYSYLLRQLKYDNTDKTLVFALLTGVRVLYDAT